ncbi:hypothetical protein Nmel_003372 [Mimus melanotis]
MSQGLMGKKQEFLMNLSRKMQVLKS